MSNRMIRIVAVLGIATVCCPRAQTDEPAEPPHIKFDKSVRSMLHDRRGNYWFGGWEEGVARFD